VSAALPVALVGLGEVGEVLARDLHALGATHLSAWDRLFVRADSAPRRLADSLPYLEAAKGMAQAVRGRPLVICAVTAAECCAAAAEAARTIEPGAFYLDLNSVSPATKAQAAHAIEAAGARYVEAAVMSPIAPQRLATPIWLGGPHAAAFLPQAHALGFTGAAVYSATPGKAAAAKMCRSVIVKGLEALLAESLVTARHYEVEDAVLASLKDLLPAADWARLARYMIGRSLQHGARRAEEMREAVRTVAEAGLDPWMSRGCVERQQWAAEHGDAQEAEDLAGLLDRLLQQLAVPPGIRRGSAAP
jgi:3-hydroxyisobutyrate dehydrogenase-like beta-hydroxyacid dehydrogenase